jgi:hypothetical protein
LPKEGRSNNSGIVSAAPDDQNELVSVETKADAAKQQLKPIDKGDVDENKENKENKKTKEADLLRARLQRVRRKK